MKAFVGSAVGRLHEIFVRHRLQNLGAALYT